MGAAAVSILLKYVCPAVGSVIAQLLFLSPLPAIRKVNRAKQLRDLNVVPFTLMAANSFCWIIYAFITKDWFIYVPNATGLVCGLYFTLQCYKFAGEAAQDQITYLVAACAALLWAVGVVNMAALPTPDGTRLLWGSTCVAALAVFYCAPLATCYSVIRHRCSASLYWPLCLMNVINGGLWCAYGLAIRDWFVAGPNGTGAVFNLFCLALCLVFPREPDGLEPLHYMRWASLRSLSQRALIGRSGSSFFAAPAAAAAAAAAAARPPAGSLAVDLPSRKQPNSSDLGIPVTAAAAQHAPGAAPGGCSHDGAAPHAAAGGAAL